MTIIPYNEKDAQLLYVNPISIRGEMAIALHPQYINGYANIDKTPLDERLPKVGRIY
jgi:hypothetical protein